MGSQNALKHGQTTAVAKAARRAIAQQQREMRATAKLLKQLTKRPRGRPKKVRIDGSAQS